MESEPTSAADVQQMSYEAAREELMNVVRTLERGGVTLEESLSLWERGEALATRCEWWLTHAKERLEAARPSSVDNHETPHGSTGVGGDAAPTRDTQSAEPTPAPDSFRGEEDVF